MCAEWELNHRFMIRIHDLEEKLQTYLQDVIYPSLKHV